jgi:AcrR family transcriptional regulator
MARRQTRGEILDAAERLLVAAANIEDVSVRRIAAKAGVNVAAIGYHFGSRDKLLVAAIKRVYDRFNAERLAMLEAAIAARAPRPPELTAVITALIAPSIRWSNDPNSSYAAFVNFGALTQQARDPAVRNTMAREIKHLRAFIAPLRQVAPWFSEAEIAWRIHCALGVRHNVVRYRARAAALIGEAFDLRDSEEVLRRTVEVIIPMFARPR